jgi:hypothetical protein
MVTERDACMVRGHFVLWNIMVSLIAHEFGGGTRCQWFRSTGKIIETADVLRLPSKDLIFKSTFSIRHQHSSCDMDKQSRLEALNRQ